MTVLKSKYDLRMAFCVGLKMISVALTSIYLFFGSLMYLSKDFRNIVLFLHVVNVPLFANFSRPDLYGIDKTENIYLRGDAGKIGAWLVKSESKKIKGSVLYLHGNGGTRATSHRVGLYKTLSKYGLNVFVIDYRGFGDSDGYPTEKGVVDDSKVAWNWLTQNADLRDSSYYIWGHSLGSGVAVQLANHLCERGSPPNGLILEAPFNNVTDASRNHPFATPYSIWPYFEDLMIKELKDVFRNDYWIKNVTAPILLLHDKSDTIVPFELGRKLCLAAKAYSLDIKCIDIEEQLNHKYIYKSKRLENILRDFEEKTKRR